MFKHLNGENPTEIIEQNRHAFRTNNINTTKLNTA